jgi:hypothetical protein
MTLQPHQSDALKRLKNGSILWGAVGTGKSRVAVEYYVLNEAPRDIYVITTAKKRDSLDWLKEFSDKGIGPEDSVAGKLVVDSWNNIDKYRNVYGAFFIFDEQRLIGSGKWVKAFLKIARKNRWVLLSATPGDTWMDYVPVFVANGFYKNRTEFKLEHVIYAPYSRYPKVLRYVGVNRLVKYRNDILVQMRFAKETIRHSKTIWVDHDVDLMELAVRDRWHPWEDRPIRDAAELFAVVRKVSNSHTSRVRAVEALLRAHERLIVFYSFNYELERLRALNEKHVVAEWNGHKHEEIPDTKKWVYLVQYTAGSEGWNCISTNAMCFFSLTSSYKKWEQSHGRIDRLNTPYIDLYYYILRSKTPIDTAIWRSLRAKKDFNYRDFDFKQLEWN